MDLGVEGPGQELVAHLQPVLAELVDRPLGEQTAPDDLLDLFDAQARSRRLDLAARRLRASGRGHYTIASAGHEGNAALAVATRADDPALLHYRSGAFFLARAGRRGIPTAVARHPARAGRRGATNRSPAAGTRCSASAAGGHPADLHHRLATCRARSASRVAIGRSQRLGGRVALARRRGGGRQLRRRLGQPLDRDRRDQRRAPHGPPAVRRAAAAGLRGQRPRHQRAAPRRAGSHSLYGGRPRLHYLARRRQRPGRRCWRRRSEAARLARERRRPALLHLTPVRMMGTPASDVEAAYRDRRRDRRRPGPRPAGGTAAAAGRGRRAATPRGAGALRAPAGRGARGSSRGCWSARRSPRPPRSSHRWRRAVRTRSPAVVAAGPPPRTAGGCSATGCRRTRGRSRWRRRSTGRAADVLARRPGALVFGEDVARQGRGLRRHPRAAPAVRRGPGLRHPARRAVDPRARARRGASAGCCRCPEIQYLAYLHNAEDQLRGEAATLQFFSAGAVPQPDGGAGARARLPEGLRRPLPQRQRGRGAARRPRAGRGLAAAHPTTPRRCCAPALAAARGRRHGLRVPGADRALPRPRPARARRRRLAGGVRRAGGWRRPTCRSAAAGLRRRHRPDHRHLRQRAAACACGRPRRLESEGSARRVLDLRWLAPLPVDDVLREAAAPAGCWSSTRPGAPAGCPRAWSPRWSTPASPGRVARVASADSFVPLGDAAELVLVSEAEIERAARHLVR